MPVDFNTVKAVFTAAMDKTPAERAVYLDQACAGDAKLRKCVESLLMAHGQCDPFFDQPAAEYAAAAKTGNTADFLEPSTKPGSLGRLGHYEVIETVGQGGMGTVLRAFDEKLHRVVAVKVLAPELAGNASARQRFVREARSAAAVSHDNVIAIYAVEDDGPIPYLIMQFIEGRTLQQKLDRTGALPLKEILRLGVQIADGLAAAHRHGLIHRDIKPANILLENGVERVKITDFGLARAVDDASLTRSGFIAGTPTYMSPEQANGQRIDHRSDLFSLGSVLYAQCAGHPPFRAETSMAVLKRVCEETPRPLRDINAEVPEWLEAMIAKLQAKDRAQRFDSAAEVAAILSRRLAQLQADGSFSDFGATQVVRSKSPRPAASRRLRTANLIGASMVLIGAAIAGWFIYQAWNSGRQEAATGGAPQVAAVAPEPAEPLVLQPSKTIPGLRNWVRSMTFSPDGKVLAVGGLNLPIALFNTDDWTLRGMLRGHPGEVFGLAFSADSSKLASTTLGKDDCAVRLWDVETGAPAGKVGEPWSGLFAVAWLPGDKTLVTCGVDKQLNFWDVATGQHETIDNVCSEYVRCLSISPNGKLIATGGTGPTRIWDLATRKEVPSQLPPDLRPLFLPPDGAEIAGWNHLEGSVNICNPATGKVRSWRAHAGKIGRIEGHEGKPGRIEGIAATPDGRFLVSVGTDGFGQVWSVADSALVATLSGHRGDVASVAITSDGKRVATSGIEDFTIRIWDLPPIFWVRK
jgi:serine/threonine protein kinase